MRRTNGKRRPTATGAYLITSRPPPRALISGPVTSAVVSDRPNLTFAAPRQRCRARDRSRPRVFQSKRAFRTVKWAGANPAVMDGGDVVVAAWENCGGESRIFGAAKVGLGAPVAPGSEECGMLRRSFSFVLLTRVVVTTPRALTPATVTAVTLQFGLRGALPLLRPSSQLQQQADQRHHPPDALQTALLSAAPVAGVLWVLTALTVRQVSGIP